MQVETSQHSYSRSNTRTLKRGKQEPYRLWDDSSHLSKTEQTYNQMRKVNNKHTHSRVLYKLVATTHTFFHFILQPLVGLSATTASGKYYHATTATSADTSMGGFKGMKVINLPHVHKPWTHTHWIHTFHSLQCSKREVAHTYLSFQIPHDKEWQT